MLTSHPPRPKQVAQLVRLENEGNQEEEQMRGKEGVRGICEALNPF